MRTPSYQNALAVILLAFVSSQLAGCATGGKYAPPEEKVSVGATAWSRNGELLAVGGTDRVWVFRTAGFEPVAVIKDIPTDEFLDQKDYRSGYANTLAFTGPDSLATTGLGAQVTRWHIPSGTLLNKWTMDTVARLVLSIAYDPTSGTLAAGTSRGQVMTVRPGDDEPPKTLFTPGGAIRDVEFSSNGRYLGALSSARTSQLVIWNMQTFQVELEMSVPPRSVDLDRLDEPGKFLTAGETLVIWEVKEKSRETLPEPSLAGQKVGAWSLWTVGIVLAAGAGSASFPDPPREKQMIPCTRATAVSPDGRFIADMHPGVLKEVIRVLDADTQEEITRLNPRGGHTCDMAFSPDSNLLLVANPRGASVYDTKTWQATKLKLD